jgi:hypothetical protein
MEEMRNAYRVLVRIPEGERGRLQRINMAGGRGLARISKWQGVRV